MALVSVNVHATCVRLGRAGAAFSAPPGAGILILGASGSGKSDLALRLIAAGAKLVADDRTDLHVSRGKLYARPPARLAGLMEIRGIGIVKVVHAPSVGVALVVELRPGVPRFPRHRRYRAPAALALPPRLAPPLVRIAPFEPSAPAKIAAAAAAYAHGLHRDDVNPI